MHIVECRFEVVEKEEIEPIIFDLAQLDRSRTGQVNLSTVR